MVDKKTGWKQFITPLIIAAVMSGMLLWIVYLFNEVDFRRGREEYLENKLWAAKVDSLSLHKSIDELEFLNLLNDIRIKSLKTKIESYETDEYHLVIDLSECKFELRKGSSVIRSGPAGVGKGTRWIANEEHDFETPVGEHEIKQKIIGPWWRRPDWFWHERGMQVPDSFIWIDPKLPDVEAIKQYEALSEAEKLKVRYVPGHLGRYALEVGDGVFIHYGSGLGRRSSHGCIRLSSNDLDAVFRVLQVGDPIFIY